eukprot:405692-Ditylum_brightwellii.AAC.1
MVRLKIFWSGRKRCRRLLSTSRLTQWKVEVARTSKNPDGSDTAPLGMCGPIFAICLQDLKSHDFLKNASCLQKAYLCNHIKKPNKLSIKNTATRLRDVIGMLAKFLVPGNTPMMDDELCGILYRMVKHDWRNALCKSGRNPSDMNLQDLTDYFEQIELLEVVKQKSKTIVVDDDNDEQKKFSSHHTKSAKAKANVKGKPPGKERKKVCVLCQQFGGNPNYHTAKDCYRHKAPQVTV